MSVMGNEFSGLPIAELIGGPLTAACDAQVKLAKATSDFINTVGFNPALDSQGKVIPGKVEPRQVDFSFWQPLPVQKKYKVTGVAITNSGSGYKSAPAVTFSGGGGTGAIETATIANGVVTGVTIPASGVGSGYTSAPTVTFSAPPAVKTATGTATIDANGVVTGVAISASGGGSGYTSAPTITFSGGGGTGATGTATIDASGVVTGVTIPASGGGSGYTSAPTVTFSAPPAVTTATGTAIVEVDTSLSSETSVQKVMISVPFLAITNVPALMVKSVDIVFDMEVKSSESHKDESGYEAGMSTSGSGGWGPFSASVEIHGSVSSHQENTRSTDRSAKYHVQVTARDEGMPEGLSRVLDILQKAIAPVSVSAATSLKNANVGQKAITA